MWINHKSWLNPFIELIAATALWGFGFTATVWVLRDTSVAGLLVLRFSIAFFAGLGLSALTRQGRDAIQKTWAIQTRQSFVPGFWLFATVGLQAWGLHTTSATKSALITCLYVMIVPAFSAGIGRERLPKTHFFWVVLALLGVAVFQKLDWSAWTTGDSLTLASAFAAAFHILSIDKIAAQTKHPFQFNLWQSGWVLLFGMMCLPFVTLPPTLIQFFTLSQLGWFGMLILGLGSSLLAFFLQIKAQKTMAPSLASMLFLLESPFSALFAFWLLLEPLTAYHLTGGALIVLACFLSIRFNKV